MPCHSMHLQNKPFQKIKSGAKEFEFRLNDPKRQLIKMGDHIVFTHTDDPTQKISAAVMARIDAPDIPGLLEKLFPIISSIYPVDILHNMLCKINDSYLSHYSTFEIETYGVVAFQIKVNDDLLKTK